ncbi:MAG: arylesterase [Aquabacterium sp.]|nr:MAG: arylesterase [Aquabacterium sp.]
MNRPSPSFCRAGAHAPDAFRRRDFIAQALALAAAAGLTLRPRRASAATPPPQRILVLGDSLSAEYGLKRGTGWVKLLEQKLAAEKIPADVVNASISGDTTSGGRARLAPLLATHKPTLLIVELGANDALRGLPLKESAANLQAIVEAARQAGARALLVGIQVPPNYGRKYTEEFAAIFTGVAQQTGSPLVPFLLKGVADDPDPVRWFQADRIHPKEEAQPRLLDNVWSVLGPLLRAPAGKVGKAGRASKA